jgi:hypothetical protein
VCLSSVQIFHARRALNMGKLMALSLVSTMFAAVLFQPVLMGRPRQLNARPDSGPNLREAAE